LILVADTNIFLAVALDEPEKEAIIRATVGADIVSPEILLYEAGNALTAMVKRKRLGHDEVLAVFEAMRSIPVKLIPVNINEALTRAVKHNIYAYDAYFLQCAWQLSCPLISLDRRLKQVATELKINVVEIFQ
jgi:predicted nucleic acid-binding protein